ncbi:hypothetical protein PAUR_a3433 [Pseudoalteromonas aurantia 208]|uniref:Uncharacterized protein n=1 Tax=Pseudoalteromonas aurantia 208 TaxID=1314867 RepID=A0ABR9E622_9GAMM|nr:hypothetical protein [Pseudoalteromonas aurantia 208]
MAVIHRLVNPSKHVADYESICVQQHKAHFLQHMGVKSIPYVTPP